MKRSILGMFFIIAAMPAFGYEYGAARDTYVGMRIHKNENIAFASEISDGDTHTARDDSFGIGLMIGNRLTDHVKIEFETSYTGGSDTKYGSEYDFDIWSNMLNVYVYQQFGGAVEPYVGMGIGVAGLWGDVHGGGLSASDATADMSWSAMVGVNFALNARIDLNLGLKYQNYGDVDMKNANGGHISTEIDATEIYIGGAYKFGL